MPSDNYSPNHDLTLSQNGFTHEFQENLGFLSFPWSRFLSGMLLCAIGLIDLQLLGYSIGAPDHPWVGSYIGTGTAVFLGGVSFFYVSGFPCLVFGIGLIIYSVAAIWKGNVQFNNSEFSLHEHRYLFKRKTTINLHKIERMTLDTNRLGPKYLWIVIWVPMIVYLYQFGRALFDQPRAVSNLLPWALIITATIELIALMILLINSTWYLSIETWDSTFELWFRPLYMNVQCWNGLGEKIGVYQIKSPLTRSRFLWIYTISIFIIGCVLFFSEFGFDPLVTISLMIYAFWIFFDPPITTRKVGRIFQFYLLFMMVMEILLTLVFAELFTSVLIIELLLDVFIIGILSCSFRKSIISD